MAVGPRVGENLLFQLEGPAGAAVEDEQRARVRRHERLELRAAPLNKEAPATQEDFTREALPSLLDKTDWAVLTAEDPGATKATPEQNAQRMAELKADLDAMLALPAMALSIGDDGKPEVDPRGARCGTGDDTRVGHPLVVDRRRGRGTRTQPNHANLDGAARQVRGCL